MSKIKSFVLKHKKTLGVALGAVTACGTAIVPVSASLSANAADAATEYANLESQMISSFSTTSDSMISVVGSILPYVLIIVGAILVINVGIRLFKRFGKG